MARKRCPRKRAHFLDDFLRAEHRDFLEKESNRLNKALPPLWYISQFPYPLDRETADAVDSLMEQFVLPWGLVEWYIEEWSYPEFQRQGVEFREALHPSDFADRPGEIPELASLRDLRGTDIGQRVLGAWADDFAEACDMNSFVIREGFFLDYPVLKGCYLLLPYLPLGEDWLSYIPLVDQRWIDRRLVELCETTAILHQRGYTRMPPLDAHSMAWHRFYCPHSRWRAPKEASREPFLTTLDEVTAAVRSMPGRPVVINGRPYIDVEAYTRWGGRHVPYEYLAEDARHIGIPVQRWNEWIQEHGSDGKVELPVLTLVLGEVESPLHLYEGESIAPLPATEEAEQALAQRIRAIQALGRLAENQPAEANSAEWLTPRQRNILEALFAKGPMDARCLARRVRCHRRTLYNPGGLNELLERKLVDHPQNSAYRITDAGRNARLKSDAQS